MYHLKYSIDQEVRIRILEDALKRIEEHCDYLEERVDTQFFLLMTTMITLFGAALLYLANIN